MKDLLEISCGLDVHKEKIVACILTGPLGKPTRSEIREFSTLIPDMIALRNWIVSKNCHHVAMESTMNGRNEAAGAEQADSQSKTAGAEQSSCHAASMSQAKGENDR